MLFLSEELIWRFMYLWQNKKKNNFVLFFSVLYQLSQENYWDQFVKSQAVKKTSDFNFSFNNKFDISGG